MLHSFGKMSTKKKIYYNISCFHACSHVQERLWKEPTMPQQRHMPVRVYRQGISMFVLSWIHGRIL